MGRARASRWPPLAVMATALAMASPAAAAEEDALSSSGVRLGIRSGYAVPGGAAFNGSGALADTISGYSPLRFDLGVRLARHFYAGALVQRGIVVPAACPGEMLCSGSNTRFGVMVGVHVLPSAVLDPWIGVGVGYEILSVTRSVGSSRLDLTARGVELLDLELGVDLRPAARVRIGPVLSTSLGRYTSVVLNGTTTRDFNTVLHGWAMIGLRGAYDL
jgi:hypothetical protein